MDWIFVPQFDWVIKPYRNVQYYWSLCELCNFVNQQEGEEVHLKQRLVFHSIYLAYLFSWLILIIIILCSTLFNGP